MKNTIEQTYYQIVKKSNIGFVLIDISRAFEGIFTIEEINNSAASAFDISRAFIEKSLNLDAFRSFLENIDDIVMRAIKRKHTEKTSFVNIYNYRTYSLEIAPFDDAHILFVVNDITPEEKVKMELEKTKDLLSSLFDSGTQSIVLLNKNQIIEAFNLNANYNSMIILGKKLKVGDHVSSLLPDFYYKEFKDYFYNAINGKIIKFDKNFQYDPNIDNWFEVIIEPIKSKHGTIEQVAIFSNPITERKRNEKEMKSLITALKLANRLTDENSRRVQNLYNELEKSEKELRLLNDSKDKFFSIIAHDLRSPFQGFLSLTKELVNNFNSIDPEELNELAVEMNNSANQLYKLLENLLQWSRLQRGNIDFYPSMHNLNIIMNMNLDLLSTNAKNKKIELKNNIQGNYDVFADVNMLNTILRNLISNAIKFTPQGGEINISLQENHENYAISIADNGVGIESYKLEKIFDIGKSKSTLGTNNETGTGLGLILCKELVEKNGGTISVKSHPGEGTTFTFTLRKVSAV